MSDLSKLLTWKETKHEHKVEQLKPIVAEVLRSGRNKGLVPDPEVGSLAILTNFLKTRINMKKSWSEGGAFKSTNNLLPLCLKFLFITTSRRNCASD